MLLLLLLSGTKHGDGEDSITEVYCPINGQYTFSYSRVISPSLSPITCSPSSTLSNCPQGSMLSLTYDSCSIPSITLQCLGDWGGPAGERYLALQVVEDSPGLGPRYRCGVRYRG